MGKNTVKRGLFLFVIFVLLLIVGFIMLQYSVEGEKEMPYSIGKILIVSTVDGDILDDPENIWNVGVTQVNDLYIYINKDEKFNQTIKEVKLNNIKISNGPSRGKVKLLRPTGDLNNLYMYSKEDFLNEGITYQGALIDDLKSLEISNIGGVIGCRFNINDLGAYVSNDLNQEVIYDGRLLSNLGIDINELRFDVSFDLIIITDDNVTYKGTLEMRLPIDTVIEEGSSSMELTDFSHVIFKRVVE